MRQLILSQIALDFGALAAWNPGLPSQMLIVEWAKMKGAQTSWPAFTQGWHFQGSQHTPALIGQSEEGGCSYECIVQVASSSC